MKLLLVALALWSGPNQPSDLDTRGIEGYLRFPGMEDVTVEWRSCGQQNAFWDRKRTVIMCTELADLPSGVQRFYLAHEMAHAVIDRLNIPYTGSEETAADELAALSMLLLGYQDDIIAMEKEWRKPAPWFDPTDPHLHDLQRGWNLTCLRWGSEGHGLNNCHWKWAQTVVNWARLLAGH